SQRENGAWAMVSRAIMRDGKPPKDLSPITHAGSAWAVMGLVRSAPAIIESAETRWQLHGLPHDPARPTKPNILVIVADDLGYGDIGVHGGKDVPTPHLDALAASGVRCTNGYVSAPYCSPSRAGFLTGRYQTRFGHEFNPHVGAEGQLGLPLDQRTIADHLRG